MDDAEFFRARARHCRALADVIFDDRARATLHSLASDYDARAADLIAAASREEADPD